jgi:glycosyltransferase involved in cell wall biosynthesis
MTQLLFSGPICETGYGIVATNQLYELDKQGKDIVLLPQGRNVSASTKYHEVIKRTANKTLEMDFNSPYLKIWHQFELLEHVGRGKYIGYPIFEMNRLTAFERLNLRACDQVLVCSKWAQDVLAQYDIASDVVPLGVDLDVFKPRAFKGERPNFIFGNFGKWEIRKGHDVLISAFNKAFSPTDKVELWLVTQNFLLSEQENAEWNNLAMKSPMGLAGKIKLFPRQESQDQVANIMSMVDCGVFPARAEGWNLEVLELMACGVPSIVTNYAGHTEFCTDDNSFLLPIDEMEDAFDGKWFKPGMNANQGQWAIPNEDYLISYLQYTVLNQHVLTKRKENCIKSASNLAWSNCAKRLSDVTGI